MGVTPTVDVADVVDAQWVVVIVVYPRDQSLVEGGHLVDPLGED